MKFNDVRPETFVKRLRCDRCGREAGHEESEFHEFTSIDYRTGYGSIFGDGNQVEIDLCQHCLKETLGNSLRVEEHHREPGGRQQLPSPQQPYQLRNI